MLQHRVEVHEFLRIIKDPFIVLSYLPESSLEKEVASLEITSYILDVSRVSVHAVKFVLSCFMIEIRERA